VDTCFHYVSAQALFHSKSHLLRSKCR
jgi:hypothetical protein